MKIEAEAKLVTIYINSTDQWHGQPLYAAVVSHCKQQGIAGATVTRASEGYGAGGACTRPDCWNLRRTSPCGSRSSTSPNGSSRCWRTWNR